MRSISTRARPSLPPSAGALVEDQRTVEISPCRRALGEKQQTGGFRVELVVGNVAQQGLQRVIAAWFVGVEGAHGDVGEQAGPGMLACEMEKVGGSGSIVGCHSHQGRDAA
jgi:hypothetical protein